jgi:hypothetical protein
LRFISHIRRNSIVIHAGRIRHTEFGDEVLIPMVIAEFQPGDIGSDELLFAERVFRNETNGRTLELDEVTPTALLGRLSTYDTDLHADEFADLDSEYGAPKGFPGEWRGWKVYTEEKLLSRSQPGSDSRLYEPAPLMPPWPRYDDFAGDLEELVLKIVEDGFHIPSILAYEEQAQKRTDVLEALRKAEVEFKDESTETFVNA